MSELSKAVRAKFPGSYDDMSDAELENAVLAKYPQYKDMVNPTEQGPYGAMVRAQNDRADRLAEQLTHSPYLPAVGGIAGTIAGTPAGPAGMIAGGAAGSAGGESLRSLLTTGENPPDPEETAKRIGIEGAIGAAGGALATPPFLRGLASKPAQAAVAGGTTYYRTKNLPAAVQAAVAAAALGHYTGLGKGIASVGEGAATKVEGLGKLLQFGKTAEAEAAPAATQAEAVALAKPAPEGLPVVGRLAPEGKRSMATNLGGPAKAASAATAPDDMERQLFRSVNLIKAMKEQGFTPSQIQARLKMLASVPEGQ